MYLVRAIKVFCDSQAPSVEESLRQVGTEFKVASKERVNQLLALSLIEIVEEPKKKEISEPKIEIEEEIVIEPKEEEIVVVKTTKSYNGGKKNGRKQSTKLGRKNS